MEEEFFLGIPRCPWNSSKKEFLWGKTRLRRWMNQVSEEEKFVSVGQRGGSRFSEWEKVHEKMERVNGKVNGKPL